MGERTTPAHAAPPARVGLLGYGVAGEAFHAPLVAAEPGMRLAAVVASDPERSRRGAREPPGGRRGARQAMAATAAEAVRATAGA